MELSSSNIKKIIIFSYISGNELYIQESLKQNFLLYCRSNFQSPKNQNLFHFSKKVMNKFFKEHFRIIFSINYINWIKKYHWYIENHLLRWIFFQLLYISSLSNFFYFIATLSQNYHTFIKIFFIFYHRAHTFILIRISSHKHFWVDQIYFSI